MTIEQLNPAEVWKNFHSLTQIPRPSKHEEKVSAFMEQFGKKLGLETVRDKVGNIIIRKPATPGMENRKGVILQGHLDMVPQKNNDVKHDFLKDPIKPRIVKEKDGDWVYATGTTLGADNGLGVAAAMAVLESKTLKHGPIEAVFTIDEETGMTGAFALATDVLKGDILLNLDSETEGEIYVGCAGGLDATVKFKYKEEDLPKGFKVFELTVKGLRGGHSGMDIHEGRANANKIIARILVPVLRDLKAKLASISGGTLRNAIPRESVAVVAVPADKVAEFDAIVNQIAADAKREYAPIDPGLEIVTAPAKAGKVMAGNVALKAVRAIYACPNGVDRMSLEVEGLVETSNNLAMVKSEKGEITVQTLLRGSIDSAKEELGEQLRACFELAGGKVSLTGGYSGWAPDMASPILNTAKTVYKKMFGNEPAVMAIHAGLECGVFGGKYPNLDMISFGPTLKSPHSPDERAFVPSVGKWWNFLTTLLENIPTK